MIAQLCGLAVDARAATRSTSPRELALAGRWIAGNLLAIAGCRLDVDGALRTPAQVAVRARSLRGLIAAIAAVPALLDPETVPVRWRLALRALGIPLLDQPRPDALAAGVSVLALVSPGRSQPARARGTSATLARPLPASVSTPGAPPARPGETAAMPTRPFPGSVSTPDDPPPARAGETAAIPTRPLPRLGDIAGILHVIELDRRLRVELAATHHLLAA